MWFFWLDYVASLHSQFPAKCEAAGMRTTSPSLVLSWKRFQLWELPKVQGSKYLHSNPHLWLQDMSNDLQNEIVDTNGGNELLPKAVWALL